MKIKPIFAWYDWWIGGYWDRKKYKLYLMLPFIGVVISFKTLTTDTVKVVCPECSGSCFIPIPDDEDNCPTCDAKGWLLLPLWDSNKRYD